jgi:hypothetical protein
MSEVIDLTGDSPPVSPRPSAQRPILNPSSSSRSIKSEYRPHPSAFNSRHLQARSHNPHPYPASSRHAPRDPRASGPSGAMLKSHRLPAHDPRDMLPRGEDPRRLATTDLPLPTWRRADYEQAITTAPRNQLNRFLLRLADISPAFVRQAMGELAPRVPPREVYQEDYRRSLAVHRAQQEQRKMAQVKSEPSGVKQEPRGSMRPTPSSATSKLLRRPSGATGTGVTASTPSRVKLERETEAVRPGGSGGSDHSSSSSTASPPETAPRMSGVPYWQESNRAGDHSTGNPGTNPSATTKPPPQLQERSKSGMFSGRRPEERLKNIFRREQEQAARSQVQSPRVESVVHTRANGVQNQSSESESDTGSSLDDMFDWDSADDEGRKRTNSSVDASRMNEYKKQRLG